MARPSKPLISRTSAAQAALDVIDERGLNELSLSLVAKKLGVKPPSLYHHFKDKSELLQEVARIMLMRIPPQMDTEQSYEESLIARCVATRRALLQHPKAALLILQYFPRYILLSAYERTTREEPYPTSVQMVVIEMVEKFTYGAALFEASAHSRGVDPMPTVDAEKYPNFAKAIEDNPFEEEELFIEALRIFLTGVRARLETKSLGQPLV